MRPKFLLVLLAVGGGWLMAALVLGSAQQARAGSRPLPGGERGFPGVVWASAPVTPTIVYEPGGDIDAGAPDQWDGIFENTFGAMVWNGTEWVIQSTWKHPYFIDSLTQQRLVTHTVAASFDGQGAPNTSVLFPGTNHAYTVTQSIYTYTVAGTAWGSFTYTASQYFITQTDGKRQIVRSRGCGLGAGVAYLDIYIEDPYAGVQVAALRGDPVFYDYSLPLEQAVLITDEVQGARASLPTFAPGRARYWMDVNQGADMGGYGYVIDTQAINCQTRSLNSAYPVKFRFLYYDEVRSQVVEMVFLPRLLEEQRRLPLFIPLVMWTAP